MVSRAVRDRIVRQALTTALPELPLATYDYADYWCLDQDRRHIHISLGEGGHLVEATVDTLTPSERKRLARQYTVERVRARLDGELD